MSILVQMPNNASCYEISETRAERLLSGDKKQATYMGLWDRFKDFFRTEKKAEVMERLYNFIHNADHLPIHEGSENYASFSKEMSSFLLLKSLATEAHKSDLFVSANAEGMVDFYIGSEKIKTLENSHNMLAMFQTNRSKGLRNTISAKATHALHAHLEKGTTQYDNLVKKLASGTITSDEVNFLIETKTPQEQLKACLEVKEYGMQYVLDALREKHYLLQNFQTEFDTLPTRVEFSESNSEFIVTHTLQRKDIADTQEPSDFQQFDATFTISTEGEVECVSLHASNKISPKNTVDAISKKLTLSEEINALVEKTADLEENTFSFIQPRSPQLPEEWLYDAEMYLYDSASLDDMHSLEKDLEEILQQIAFIEKHSSNIKMLEASISDKYRMIRNDSIQSKA